MCKDTSWVFKSVHPPSYRSITRCYFANRKPQNKNSHRSEKHNFSTWGWKEILYALALNFFFYFFFFHLNVYGTLPIFGENVGQVYTSPVWWLQVHWTADINMTWAKWVVHTHTHTHTHTRARARARESNLFVSIGVFHEFIRIGTWNFLEIVSELSSEQFMKDCCSTYRVRIVRRSR